MAGEGLAGANDGLGTFTGTLRGILDGIANFDQFLSQASCFLQGTFLGNWSC
jgi:hypothetical protein